MVDPAITEIMELHAFFGAWYGGRSEPADFTRMEATMAPEFVIVTPDGRSRKRSEIIEAVRTGYGSRPMRIWVEDPTILWRRGDVTCARYQEWQDAGTGPRGRISTALFRDDPTAPNGVVWLHLHETWLPT